MPCSGHQLIITSDNPKTFQETTRLFFKKELFYS